MSIKKYSREKLVFAFSSDFFEKGIQLIIANFQTQFIDNKRKLQRENQWKKKLFRLVETIFYNGSHLVYW